MTIKYKDTKYIDLGPNIDYINFKINDIPNIMGYSLMWVLIQINNQ